MKISAFSSRIPVSRPACHKILIGGLLAGLCLVLPVSGPVNAQSSGTSEQPSTRHSPSVQANKIVVPQIASAQLTTDHASTTVLKPVLLRFKVTNTTKKPITYDFPSGQQAEFAITDSKGNPVWDSNTTRVSFQGITHLTIAAGQSHTYAATWNGRTSHGIPAPAGVYTANAKLVPMPRVVTTGGLIVNTDPDPDNTGMPTKGAAESGAVLQQDTTPPVSASVQITIREAEPRSTGHSAAAH